MVVPNFGGSPGSGGGGIGGGTQEVPTVGKVAGTANTGGGGGGVMVKTNPGYFITMEQVVQVLWLRECLTQRNF